MKGVCSTVVVSGVVLAALVAFPVRSTAQTTRPPYCRLSRDPVCKDKAVPAEICILDVVLSNGADGCKVRNIKPGWFIDRKAKNEVAQPRAIDEGNRAALEAALPDHQLQLCLKDAVAWRFRNHCDATMDLGVDNFRADQAIIERYSGQRTGIDKTDPQNNPNGPLAPECALKVSVPQGTTALVLCKIKEGASMDRGKQIEQTYKYDIVTKDSTGKWITLLDPEFELYP